MNLANYISDLLYRYNCVIIPDFGGFVTNKIGAKVNETSNTFYPPAKQITFNSHLKVNDGLLTNYIASSENITFEKASGIIALSVTEWKNEINTKPIQIGAVGVLTLNENDQIIFEPNTTVNYLTESFGLTSVASESIKRNITKVKPLIPILKKENKKGIPTFIKYAATAAIMLTLSFAGNNAYQQNKQESIIANQEKAIEKKIQSATFVITNPLPTIALNVLKEEVVSKPYHVVAGAFQFPENAEKKVNQLKKQGYKASILGANKWGLIEVAFDSFLDKNEAINNLYKIQATVSEDAWLLIKK
ncbi:Sporulation related domain-containing protein [Polaribacter sp. Hel1_33_78]|uniref:HU domain-containing protein n=1 Tax=Polaribacter sp. Hel1_33_78 TaxID=1336804 RepID=UPI00087AF909|nr:SPOR domain-containing protein [Polaribacter sp. Hel1_33_78]SDU23873.1 Sporulation related domain-containing protein [Polaribacter sp. Hel1_33_78]